MGSRKIKPSKGKHNRHKVPNTKLQKMIHCESTLERDYVKVQQFDSSTINIIYQPIEIKYSYRGRKRRYYPDFLVEKENGEMILVEVKPEAYVKSERNALKFLVGKNYAQLKGWEYRIVTEFDIRKGLLIPNLDTLDALSLREIEPDMEVFLRTLMQEQGSMKFSEVVQKYGEEDEGIIYGIILNLIYTEVLYVDLVREDLTQDFTIYWED